MTTVGSKVINTPNLGVYNSIQFKVPELSPEGTAQATRTVGTDVSVAQATRTVGTDIFSVGRFFI